MRRCGGAEWADWLASHGIVALDGVDTRTLVRHIREAGAMRAAAVADEASSRGGGARADPRSSRRWRARRSSRPSPRVAPDRLHEDGRVRVAVVDYGVKTSIMRRLRAGGRRGDGVPARRRPRRARRLRRRPPLERPRRPRAARRRGRGDPRAARPHERARHLPRPPAARRSPPGTRPTSCRSATAAPTTRCSSGRRAACSSRARTTASRSRPTRRAARRPTSRSTTAPSRASTIPS